MQQAKLDVFFAFFPYGGNGGVSSEHPSIRKWFARTMLKLKADPRVGEIFDKDYCDTPIPMTRNASVLDARHVKADVLVMCDSDQFPDLYVGQDPTAKPFWDSSFDFLYARKMQGKCTVVAAPYCGPPPRENVYIFRWASYQSDHQDPDARLDQFTREEVALRGGIEDVAALPTGLIMYDMSVFDILPPPWFYYEWVDEYQAKKASTEDVTATRDMSLIGLEKLGYSPVYCNWDAWAGHWKPKCVGKPGILTVDQVGEKYKKAMAHGYDSSEKMVFVQRFDGCKEHVDTTPIAGPVVRQCSTPVRGDSQQAVAWSRELDRLVPVNGDVGADL